MSLKSTKYNRFNWLLQQVKLVYLNYLLIILGSAWIYHDHMAALYLLGINLFLAVTIYSLRFRLLPETRSKSKLCLLKTRNSKSKKVSIHISTPQVIAQEIRPTLNSLINQSHSNKEIILTTSNISHVEEKRLTNLYPDLTIIRSDKTNEGTMLNKCLQGTKSDAEYIFVIRQGCEIQPHTIESAIEEIEKENLGFVQYSTSPSIHPNSWCPNLAEQDFYFDTYLNLKASPAVLLGENVLIKKHSLLKVAGWWEGSSHALKTGIKLVDNGYKGTFDSSSKFKLVQVQLEKLVKKNSVRLRDARKNLTLADLSCLDLKQCTALVLQLTPKNTFIFYPLVVMICLALAGSPPKYQIELIQGAELLAATTIMGSMYFTLLLYLQKLGSTIRTGRVFKVFFASISRCIEDPFTTGILSLNNTLFRLAYHFTFATLCFAVSLKLFQVNNSVSAVVPSILAFCSMTGAILNSFKHNSYPQLGKQDVQAMARPG